jgi:glycine hydroxymethyltransferase
MIPGDLRSPFDPSGIRLGVANITTRGMTESDMAELASIINDTLANPTSKSLLSQSKKRVAELCQKFPIPS